MRIYLTPDISCDTDKVMDMKTNMQATYLLDVLQTIGTDVFFDIGPLEPTRTGYTPDEHKEDGRWVKLFYAIQCNQTFLDVDSSRLSKHEIRLAFDSKLLERRGLTVNAIAIHLKGLFDGEMLIAYSDMTAQYPAIRMRLIYPKKPTNDELNGEEKFMKQFLRQHIKQLQLCGANTISKVFVTPEEEPKGPGESGGKRRFCLETEGSDLKRVLNWSGVDTTRTYCNNPTEIIRILGVEAARQSIIIEIRKVMNFYGIQVNYRHLGLLGDTMTYRGKIMAINRHGLNHTKVGPLKKCTFEETVDMLLDAGKESMYDDLSSVSASLIVGKLGKFGTGVFDLKFNKKQFDNERKHRTSGKTREDNSSKPQRYYNYANNPPSNPQLDRKRRKETPLVPNNPKTRIRRDSSLEEPEKITQQTPYTVYKDMFLNQDYNPEYPMGKPSEVLYSPTRSVKDEYDPLSNNNNEYSPASPTYSPSSPRYSPSSPRYSPSSPRYSPTSPRYSPSNPTYENTPSTNGFPSEYNPYVYNPTYPSSNAQQHEYDPAAPLYDPAQPTNNQPNTTTPTNNQPTNNQPSATTTNDDMFSWF